MDEEEEYTPLLYPPFIERSYPNRTLAYWDQTLKALVLETGQALDLSSYQDFKDAIFGHDLLTFIDTLTTFPFLSDIVEACNPASKRGTAIFCTPQGEMINARIRNRNYTRWLITAFSWGLHGLSPAVLATLRRFYDHCEVGTQTTPGASGQAVMRRTWREQFGNDWYGHRHLRPPGAALSMLRQESTGQRSELIEGLSAGYKPAVIELDLKNAYAASFVSQPTGHTIRFVRGMTDGLRKYFARCIVTIPNPTPLLLGCFPQRIEQDGMTELCYPTLPGVYRVSLWNTEIDVCQEEGLQVQVLDGYGWRHTTRDPEAFTRTMEVLRDTAPNEDVATYVKLATVAAIGRHGMPDESYLIGTEPSDLHISYQGKSYEWYVHKVWDDHPTGMQHWFSHTLMQCRVALYREARKWRAKELLYGTNVDAVYLDPQADVDSYVDKREPVASGTWRKDVWHGTPGKETFPAVRHIDAIEKQRHPGKAKQRRNV